MHWPYLSLNGAWSQLGHVPNAYGFPSTSISPIATEIGSMVNQHIDVTWQN